MASELTCPKCQGAMRTYERNGIQIDQCTGCRGVFLDRGELEHLLDAEAAYNQTSQSGPAQPQAPAAASAQVQGYGRSDSYYQRPASGDGHHGKRRKSFLGELFD
jgi:uncharacterized protein